VSEDMKAVFEVGQKVHAPGYDFEWFDLKPYGVGVRVAYDEPDVETGAKERRRGRWWLLPYNAEPTQVVQTCFKAVLTSLEHRLREHFTHDGRAVLQPHFKLEALEALAPERKVAG
jgi:hypothetical protein